MTPILHAVTRTVAEDLTLAAGIVAALDGRDLADPATTRMVMNALDHAESAVHQIRAHMMPPIEGATE